MPHSDSVSRSAEFTQKQQIHIWTGTFNLNGRSRGLSEDLSAWLCESMASLPDLPTIVVVGFQEIVELSPQQIMSTDPRIRTAWEEVARRTLNLNAKDRTKETYVLLRGGQLVGASLSIFVRSGALRHIKDVEGSVKKVAPPIYSFTTLSP